MLPGEWKTITIAAGASESSEADLGRNYDTIDVHIPVLEPPATFNIKTAEKTGDTFRELDPNVVEDVGSGNKSYSFEIGNWQYIKVKLSRAQNAGRTFKVRGSAT